MMRQACILIAVVASLAIVVAWSGADLIRSPATHGPVSEPSPTIMRYQRIEGESTAGFGTIRVGGNLDVFVRDEVGCIKRCQGYNRKHGSDDGSLSSSEHCFGVVVITGGPVVRCRMKNLPMSRPTADAVSNATAVAAQDPFVPSKVSYFLDHRYEVNRSMSIVFAVLAAPLQMDRRLIAQFRTFLKSEESVVFLEDTESVRETWSNFTRRWAPKLEGIRTSAEFITEPGIKKQRGVRGAWKNLPILKRMHELHPKADWLAIIDDDSYVLTENLRITLSTYHQRPWEPLGVGTLMRAIGVTFLQGGAGILLNRLARKQLLRQYDRCVERCLQWAGDIRLGCCAQLTETPLRRDMGFWWQPVAPSIGRDHRPDLAAFPVSFHELRESHYIRDVHTATEALNDASEKRCNGTQIDEVVNGTEMCSRRLAGEGIVPVTWDALVRYYRLVWGNRYPIEDYISAKRVPRDDVRAELPY